jgi:hypothetical protein
MECRFVFLPGYGYSRDAPPVNTVMLSTKINEVDPQLLVEPHAVEFNSFEKARVRITVNGSSSIRRELLRPAKISA